MLNEGPHGHAQDDLCAGGGNRTRWWPAGILADEWRYGRPSVLCGFRFLYGAGVHREVLGAGESRPHLLAQPILTACSGLHSPGGDLSWVVNPALARRPGSPPSGSDCTVADLDSRSGYLRISRHRPHEQSSLFRQEFPYAPGHVRGASPQFPAHTARLDAGLGGGLLFARALAE